MLASVFFVDSFNTMAFKYLNILIILYLLIQMLLETIYFLTKSLRINENYFSSSTSFSVMYYVL
jgi:hypothetical protein